MLGDGGIIAMVCTGALVGMGIPLGMVTPVGMGILLGILEEYRGQGCPNVNGYPGEQPLAGIGIFTTAG